MCYTEIAKTIKLPEDGLCQTAPADTKSFKTK